MTGENFVILQGYISGGELKLVGDNLSLFKGKLRVPIDNKFQIIKISAWGAIAEALSECKEMIRIHGHIEESSYPSKCRFCKSPETKYWTEVIIDNFSEVRK